MGSFLQRYKFWMALGFWLLPLALSAAPRPTDVVAEIDSFRITVADVQKKLAALSVQYPEKRFEQLRRAALDELINDYLLNLKARSIPIENDTIFLQQADYLLAQIISRELFNRVVLSTISVTDKEIAERYGQKPEAYRMEEWTHAQHILVAPVTDTVLLTPQQKQTGWWAETEEKAKAIIDSLYRMLEAGTSFDSLARRWSQDMASGVNGGDLGVFSRGQMVPEFDSVVFNLPVGAVSLPFKTGFGYHIVRVKRRQKSEVAPFSDSLKEVIRQQVQNGKIVARSRSFLDSLKAVARPAFNQKVLELPDSILQTKPIWAAATAYGDTVWSGRLGAHLASLRSPSRPVAFSREQKIEVLNGLIAPFLMRRAAEHLGISGSDSVQKEKERIYQNERVNRLRREAILDYTPTEGEIKSYYNEHKPEFFRSESVSVHVQQMVFKTKREAEKVFQELSAGADFALLAKKYFPGDSDIAREAFDLGFISPPSMPGKFFSVAETLTAGAVSHPVKTEWGYHLMRVLARRPDLSFEAARRKVVYALRMAKQEERRKKWESSLWEGHVVKVNERTLKRINPGSADAAVSEGP